MVSLTRRQSIFAIAAVGSSVAFAGVGFLISKESSIVESIIRRRVGDFQMDDEQLTALVDHLRSTLGTPGQAKTLFYRMVTATDPDTLLRWAPGRAADPFHDYERRVVTAFITRTNYLKRASPTEAITFIASDACTSPFAKFKMSEAAA